MQDSLHSFIFYQAILWFWHLPYPGVSIEHRLHIHSFMLCLLSVLSGGHKSCYMLSSGAIWNNMQNFMPFQTQTIPVFKTITTWSMVLSCHLVKTPDSLGPELHQLFYVYLVGPCYIVICVVHSPAAFFVCFRFFFPNKFNSLSRLWVLTITFRILFLFSSC